MLGGYQHEPAALLARRLADFCPGELNHVFFTDSGSVAIEVAMKMAIQFWLNNGIKGRYKFISKVGIMAILSLQWLYVTRKRECIVIFREC